MQYVLYYNHLIVISFVVTVPCICFKKYLRAVVTVIRNAYCVEEDIILLDLVSD